MTAFSGIFPIVNTTFTEGRERNRAVAVWGGAGAAGLVIGVLLGGVLTQSLGWEAVFFVNVPLAGLAILLAFALIPADAGRKRDRRFDLPGALRPPRLAGRGWPGPAVVPLSPLLTN